MRKRLIDIFLRVANKFIIRLRAGKRLAKIKARFDDEKIYSREDCKRMVNEDWKTAQNVRLGAGDDADDINNIRFKFTF